MSVEIPVKPCYYIDTAREKDTKQQKQNNSKQNWEENKMVTTIIGIGASFIFCGIAIYVTYKICTNTVR